MYMYLLFSDYKYASICVNACMCMYMYIYMFIIYIYIYVYMYMHVFLYISILVTIWFSLYLIFLYNKVLLNQPLGEDVIKEKL